MHSSGACRPYLLYWAMPAGYTYYTGRCLPAALRAAARVFDIVHRRLGRSPLLCKGLDARLRGRVGVGVGVGVGVRGWG